MTETEESIGISILASGMGDWYMYGMRLSRYQDMLINLFIYKMNY